MLKRVPFFTQEVICYKYERALFAIRSQECSVICEARYEHGDLPTSIYANFQEFYQ